MRTLSLPNPPSLGFPFSLVVFCQICLFLKTERTRGRKTKRKKYLMENFRQTSKYCLLTVNRRRLSIDEENTGSWSSFPTSCTLKTQTTPPHPGSYSKCQTRQTGMYRKSTSKKWLHGKLQHTLREPTLCILGLTFNSRILWRSSSPA